MVRYLVPTEPIQLAIDETLERCWGEKIEALRVYRDPVRSSPGHFVKVKGLRWVSLMLQAAVPVALPPQIDDRLPQGGQLRRHQANHHRMARQSGVGGHQG